jgi:hypothetical protein
MPFDQWSRERRGVEATTEILKRWQPAKEEEQDG